ncbi:MAG: TetR/AcrR family transcriptional regulator [Acidimicrobiales bacterium]|nr:TetR/AcrR family transcriptional regulator [Acidimicrobiales bacterium]
MSSPSPRERLLEAIIDELDRGGLGERSLRELAASVGTSHRMLIHHFGSREAIFVAVVEAVEAAERARAVAIHLEVDPAEHDPIGAMRSTWRRLSDPGFAGRERLFFECYARGLQGEAPFDRLLPAAVTDWLQRLELPEPLPGMTKAQTRAFVRLGLAVMRGLLLDLLATGDRRGTTAAFEQWLDLVQRGMRPPAPGR